MKTFLFETRHTLEQPLAEVFEFFSRTKRKLITALTMFKRILITFKSDRQNNIIIACIGIPLAILAIGATVWGILAHRRSRKNQALENRIETLTSNDGRQKMKTFLFQTRHTLEQHWQKFLNFSLMPITSCGLHPRSSTLTS